MSGNSTVSLTLQIKGQQASQEMKRISDQQVQATSKINTQWTKIGSAQAKFVNTARAGTRETLNTARAGEQLLRTNRLLEGVLRQQSIQTRLQSQLLRQQVSSAQQLVNSAKKSNNQLSERTSQLNKPFLYGKKGHKLWVVLRVGIWQRKLLLLPRLSVTVTLQQLCLTLQQVLQMVLLE